MYKITSFKYINNNKKETILFLHGWGCNKDYMLPLADKIKDTNCLLIDLPGFKDNEEFKKSKTFNDFVNYIYNFIIENKFNVSYIVGHSFGGKLAVKLCERLNINCLFLLAPSIFNKKRGLNYYIKIVIYKIIKRIPLFKSKLHLFGSKDYKQLNNVMKKTMSNVINYKLNLKNFKIKTYLIYGLKDKITPLYIGKKAHRKIANSYLIKILI